MAVKGSIAYCAQQPWIQSGSIENNVTFGKPLDKTKLALAISCTCLQSDIENMPSGMNTILGDKGTSLSGGQKTRIALARAVYSDADIFLLDDPLYSLDAQVSSSLIENCFKSTLKGKTIFLVTQNHEILKETDHVIYLQKNGEMLQGSFDDLIKEKEFSDFLEPVRESKGGLTQTKRLVNNGVSRNNSIITINPPMIIADKASAAENVRINPYKTFFRASGGWTKIAPLAVVILFKICASVLSSFWLTWWCDNLVLGKSHNVYFWTGWYHAIVWIVIVLSLVMSFIIHAAIMQSAITLHDSAISGVMNAPIWWFESQQIGRIMNRFTKDVTHIDLRLLPNVFHLIANVSHLFSIVAIVGINVPYLL
ncbi:Multidrug resistance-associated protein 4, partial [Rhizoclosmatium hyalinum]